MVTLQTLRLAIDARPAAAGAATFDQSATRVRRAATGAAGATAQLSKAVAGLAAYATLGNAIRVMAGFEERIIIAGKVARATEVEFAKLEATAKALGATTRFTAEEAAEGLIALARAGFEVTEQVAAIEDTLKLATAAELELGEASGYVANSLRQFGLAATEAVRVADAFVVASNRSNTDVRQLADAMGYAGTIAATLGLSIEQTASLIGVLGDRGIQASMAGTNLRGVLLALTDPTEKVERALAELGLTYDDVNPATNDFLVVLENFGDAIDRLPNRLDAAGLMTQIFGRRNAAAAIAMAESVDKARELTKAQEESLAAHRDIAEELEKTLIGRFNALKSATQAVMIETGEAGLTGALKGLLDTATGALRILGGVEGSFDDVGRAAEFAAVAVAALSARLAFAGLASVIPLLGRTAVAIGGVATAAGGLAAPLALAAGGIAVLALEMKSGAEAAAGYASAAKSVREAVEQLDNDDFQRALEMGGEGATEAIDKRIAQLNAFIEAAQRGRGVISPSKAQALFPDLTGREERARLGLSEEEFRRDDRTSGRWYISEDLIRLAAEEIEALNKSKNGLEERAEIQQEATEAAVKAAASIQAYVDALREENEIQAILGATAEETARLQAVARELVNAEQQKGTALTETETQAITELVVERENLAGAIRAQIEAEQEAARLDAEAAARLEKHTQAAEDYRTQLERTIAVEELRLAGRDREADLLEFEASLKQRGIMLQESEAVALRELYERLLEVTDAREKQGRITDQTYDRVEQGIDSLREEIETRKFLVESVGLTEEAYEKARDRQEIMSVTTSLLANANAEQAEQILAAREALLQYVDATYEAEKQTELIREFQDGWVDMWADIVTGAATAADAFEAFALRMVAAMNELILKRALMNAFFNSGPTGSLGGGGNPAAGGASTGVVLSRGGMFDTGGQRAFSRGFIADSATPIFYSGGSGIVGEAGRPEVVAPLEPDSKGNMGIRINNPDALGGGPRMVVNMTVYARDADSFRSSQAQIEEDLRTMGTTWRL